MVAGTPSWYRINPTGTFVQGSGHPFRRFDLNERYTIASVRRVVHPSVGTVLDRACLAASSSQWPPTTLQGISPELYYAAAALAPERRQLLAQRSPEAVIPVLGLAGTVLAPLQLIGPVPCVRLYHAQLTGLLAETIYSTPAASSDAAPEARLDAEVLTTHQSSLRYLDCLWPSNEPRWQTTPLVLISNAECRPEGYLDVGRSECERLVRLLDDLPTLSEQELSRLPVVPDSHSDWGTALIVRAALR